MGKSGRLKRQVFFAEHPVCCFCGGETPAVEMDHIPARYLFSGRQWPEGYVFPACAACNDLSAADEHIMGFLVRIQLSNLSENDERELEQAVWQIRDRHPELFNGLKELKRSETRRFLREQGLSMGDFPAEPYVVTVPDELAAVPKRYGEKLGRALYYLHTGRVVPKNGWVSVRVMTNAQFMSPKFPLDTFRVLDRRPIVTRSGNSLEGQFSYRYAATEDVRAAAFLVRFRESTAMLILVFEEKTDYDAAKERIENVVA